MATIDVKDAAGITVPIEKPLAPGRAAAVASRPVVLSTEDVASLAAIVAAIEALPAGGDASAANQETAIAGLAAILAKLSADPATQTTLAAVLAKLSADPATQTTLVAILAKMIAAPATEAKQDTLIAKDFATQTTLAALLAKVIAAPATEAKQDTMIARAVAQLGARTVAQSPAVNLATDDPQIGTKVTAVTALGAGGAGLIGWLSQIWDRLNSGLGLIASENHVGSVTGLTSYIDVTLSLDTSIYASGDVLADTQVVTNAMRVNDGTGVLQSITVIDQDDQKAAFSIYLLSANVSMGTENAAPSISDANAVEILGPPIAIAVGDYYDLGGVSVAGKDAIGKIVKPATGTRNLYVAVVNGAGTPTYTASGVRLRLGFLQD